MFYVIQEEFPVWRLARRQTTDDLCRLMNNMRQRSRSLDISGPTSHAMSISGAILIGVGGISMLLPPLGIPLIVLGVVLSTGGHATGTVTSFRDSAVKSRSEKKDAVIMKRDEKGSRRFRDILRGLGVTSKRLSTWARSHPRKVSQWTEQPLDNALAMCGVFSSIRNASGYVPSQNSTFFGKSASSRAAFDIHYRIAFLEREMHLLNFVNEKCTKFLD